MTIRSRLALVLFASLCLCVRIPAQTPATTKPAKGDKSAALAITAAPTADGLRFTVLGQADKLRLEVYDAAGELLLDTGFRRGNMLDWGLDGGTGQILPDGAYTCVLTAHDIAGGLRVKQGGITVQGGRAALELPDAGALAEDNGATTEQALTVMPQGAAPAMTVTAHDGQEGRIVSTRGALSLRIGNLFAGLDREVMRLSENGDVHINGVLHAAQGLEFADGTVQTTGTSGRKDAAGNIVPAVAGTGTQNFVAKWTETGGSGTLGNSLLFDNGTNVGIGTNNPLKRFHVAGGPLALDNLRFVYARRTNGNFQEAFGIDNNDDIVFNRNAIVPGVDADAPQASAALIFGTGAGRFMDVRNAQNVPLFRIFEATGNVGIGTPTPQAKLDVRGHLVLDAGGDPVFYTGTAGAELNRYLQLINSPASPSASGLKAGGLLVADSFGFANPSKNDLIVKGNTGLGLASPQSKLHLFGSANIASPFRGLTIEQTVNLGAMTNGYAMSVATTTNNVTTTNFLIDSVGNVAVGTNSPTARFTVGGAGAFNAGSAARFDLFNTSFGGGFLQHVSDAGLWQLGTTAGATRLVVDASGRVGIGTLTPTAAKLVVQDTSVGTAVYGTNNTNGSGVFGETTSTAGFGVYGNAPGGGYAIYANGNAGQALNAAGFVKAMLLVNADGSINRCYNSQLTGSAATTPPCGLSVTHFGGGNYQITFPFRVDDRFYSATAGAEVATVKAFSASSQVIQIGTLLLTGPTDGSFHLIVY